MTKKYIILPKKFGSSTMKTKIKQRVVWGFNPVTRVVKSKKIYNRNRQKQLLKKEIYQ
jgi:hypothetical protein